MLADAILWLTNAVIALLIVRAVRGSFVTKYPLFFIYLCYVLVVHALAFYVYSFRPEEYLSFYWYTQFLGAAISYCVIWEIYSHVLRNYPGTFQIARSVVSIFFLGVLGIAVLNAFNGEASGLVGSVIRFERNLQTVQAVLLILLLSLIRYYVLPLGRNVRGLIFGYGSLIGVGIITLTLRSYLGPSFQLGWQYLQQTSYLIASVIWAETFWVYAPNPEPDMSIRLEEDYAVLTERTFRAIVKARDSVLRVFLS